MGLTRITAQQISDIDYKQAVRVILLSNTNLTGGAPATVDGVSLSANDRVLVNGQTTGSQNGLYYVQTVGGGATGTWVRTTDGDVTGEIEAGMIVMVTEGLTYKDTQWKLTTNNPIVIGSTALTFEQNSAYAFGNVYANGTAVLASSVGDVLTLTAGTNISITGNASAKSVTVGVSGISLNSISNGTSNVNVVASGGNVTVGVGGTSNVVVIAPAGEYVTGVLSVSGNANVGNLETPGIVNATGNILGANVVASGNVTGSYILGNGSQLTGISVTTTKIYNGTSNVDIATANGNVAVSVNGTSNLAVFSPGSLLVAGAVTGVIGYPKTITSNVQVAADSTAVVISPLTVANGVSITVPTGSTLYVWTPA